MKQKTVADAITVVDEAANERGVSSLYSFDRSREISVEPLIESMFDVLFATTKLERDFKRRSVMCYPGRHSSVPSQVAPNVASIHKESQDSSIVDVKKEFEAAYQVFLTPDYRLWSWNHDRFAYTFPLRGIDFEAMP